MNSTRSPHRDPEPRDDAPLDRARVLIMGELDGELSPAEREELRALLETRSDLAEELRQLRHLRETTTMTRLHQPPDEAWDSYWQDVYRRAERGTAWILVSLGAITLAGWGIWQATVSLLEDSSVPLFVKLAILALGLGGVILGISVVREKLFTRRHDPFLEVRR